MFFCRHQLLRPPAQRHFSNLLTTRRAPRLPTPLPAHKLSALYARSSSSLPGPDGPNKPTPSTPAEQSKRTASCPRSPPEHSQPGKESAELEEEDNEENDPAPHEAETPSDPKKHGPPVMDPAKRGQYVAAYLEARKTHGLDTLIHFSAADFRDLAWDIVQCKRIDDVMDLLVEDAAHILRMRPNRFRYPAVFLLEELGPQRRLRRRHMLTLMRALRKHGRLQQIRLKSSIEIAMGILRMEELNNAAYGELLGMLYEWLSQLLRGNAGKPDPFKYEQAGPGHMVPLVTWPLLRVLVSLAQRGEQETASALMRLLIEKQCIHPMAIEKTDLGANDYVYVVLSVLVRTCLQYGWFSRASSLLIPIVSARRKFSRPLALLVQDWLKAALDEPRDVDLTDAAAMLIMHFQRAVDTVIHDSMLQQFYSAAAEAKAGELAQAVYRHSREITHYSYNPPGGPALIWFILYLRGVRRDVHLSRVLTNHIAEGNVHVVPFARNAVVYNAAAQGFTLPARTLWERWSEGADGKYIAASSATMLRFVSAFTNTEATVLRAANRSRFPGAAASRINSPDEPVQRAGDQADAVQQTIQHATANDRSEETNPASDAPRSPSPPPPHDNAVQLPSSSDGADLPAPPDSPSAPSERGAGEREDQERIGTAGLTREELLARAADIRRFTERVFDTYYELKQPLETADRPTVNAIAHGAFMLGRDELAFEVFNLMRSRDMRLDLHDLNVVISVVAKANPERGVERIQKMIDNGLEPDAVTYGTVIHWAIFHGNPTLVRTVIDMARKHGLENFSFKTLAALLHATVSPDFSPETSPSEQLETVEDILSTMLDLGIIPTPNVGRDCVRAALAAEDPVLAFRFWKELMKDKVEFADGAQRQLRGRIGEQIQEHFDAGWLDEDRARVMLSELGYEIFSLVDRRRLAAKEKVLPGMDER
ncbi:hypothetical protein L227DRAFT_599572 [Lentinus tigrinus ALCF2SS1-6]|uniref:Pentacotripeptide-repeat region of PRORP domain-containing protein n=1 Tax=Lentinus tigrinus ALCF2SS1-6 TaxID=1328759 RepID=A0A5C2SG97_9APHY|nr:hypothetical protein L227DRAFT_599572 [Lentinus tigrinus ALCF2SS1-6]